jgi:uncharacterized protein
MEVKKIEIDGNTFEINVDSKDSVIIERHFSRYTKRDLEIRNLPIPIKPIWLHMTIYLIRFYQKRVSHKLGNRCVFDPSCSHYSELAFRRKGFIKGFKITIKRLYRCRPNNGGVDEVK